MAHTYPEHISEKSGCLVYMKEGTIYALISGDKIYVGSTIQPLKKRMTEHRSEHKRYLKGERPFCASFDILKDKKHKLVILEKVKVKSASDLHTKEQAWINKKSNINRIRSMVV